ncbi:hypothetical protein GNZ12_15880 [Paraburkholderia sp. 1N]|uniref:Uncharacterized protein n=1 Tax=Paraburkholderia solitsugae TaxID=2675748 RepID=A0ABX2BTB0_9BURK|nr:hypothetical protein [Paraburkholderia solitsugae]NPT42762.1 hypothetical protein [Paraburkholderia solitsugae]
MTRNAGAGDVGTFCLLRCGLIIGVGFEALSKKTGISWAVKPDRARQDGSRTLPGGGAGSLQDSLVLKDEIKPLPSLHKKIALAVNGAARRKPAF